MKQILLIVLLYLIQIVCFGQNYMWIKEIKGSGQVNPVEIEQDNNGNYYVYGNFNGEVVFDSITFTAILQDIFIAKYSSKGNLMWVKHISGSGTESAYGLKLNAQQQALYISGVFNSNPINILGTNIWNNGGNDIFLAKIDVNGNILWAKNVVYGSSHQMGGYFDLDMYNNIIMCGSFINSVIFNGDQGMINIDPEEPVQRQNFIVKFNEHGEFIWSNLLFSTSSLSYLRNVNVSNNEYYFSGQIAGIVKYKNSNIITNLPTNYRSGIIFKLSSDGNLQWLRKIVPNSSDFYIIKHTSDQNNNQYITGRFTSKRLRFDSTHTDTSKKIYINVSHGTSDIYVAKYNNNGNLQWVKIFGGNKDENVLNIKSRNNRVILTGYHSSKVSFGTYTIEHLAQQDAFVVILDENGNTIDGVSAQGKLNESGVACLINPNNRNFIWVGEYFSDTLTISNHIQMINTSYNRRDGFIVRFGCFDSIGVEIVRPSCPNSNNGVIKAIPSFGSGPYTFQWNTGATTDIITNLPVGNYSVTITGVNGCSMSRAINLTHHPLLQASIINVQHINCYGSNTGSATANPINGVSPYSYIWSNGKTTQTINNVPAGVYTVTIRDACNTTSTASVTITQSNKISAYVTNTPVTCYGGNDGTATAHPVDGLPPYSYNWSVGQTTQTAVGLLANTTYRVTVKDACNNTVVRSTVLSQPNPLNGSVTTYASSPCQPTGVAVAQATNGTPPYRYLWNTGDTTSIIQNIPAGTYTVTIRDACNASKSIARSVAAKNINITRTINCTSPNQCTGSITVNVTGGDPPYIYLWSNGQTTQTATNLCKGNYRVTVTDYLGCTKISNLYTVPTCKTFIVEYDIETNLTNEKSVVDTLRIYPNPATRVIYIDIPEKIISSIYNIKIIDVIGNKIFETNNIQHPKIEIEASFLSNGIYFILIYYDNNIMQQKISIHK